MLSAGRLPRWTSRLLARSCSAATAQRGVPPEVGWQDPLPDGVTAISSWADAEKAVKVLTDLPAERRVAWDTETVGIDVKTQSPAVFGRVICASAYAGLDVDFGHGPKLWVDELSEPGTLGKFQEYFQASSAKKVFHNASFDAHMLGNHGIRLKGFGGDTMHMARLLDSSRTMNGGYSLEALSRDWLPETDQAKVTMKQRFGKTRTNRDGKQVSTGKLPPLDTLQCEPETRSAWVDYSTEDARLTYELMQLLEGKLDRIEWQDETAPDGTPKQSLWALYNDLWLPFGELLIEMERRGIRMDSQYLQNIEQLARKQRDQAENEFIQWVSRVSPGAEKMNLMSDLQKQQLFFAPCQNASTKEYREEIRTFETENIEGYVEDGKTKPKKMRPFEVKGLGFSPVEYTKSGWPSTSSSILKKLAGDVGSGQWGSAYDELGGGQRGEEACKAIDALSQVSSMNKLINTFIVPLQEKTDDEQRIHTSLNINTETGRLSSRNPNLQNQPALEKDVFQIRSAFTCSAGNTLIVADYGQLELRILAHLSQCVSMIDAFHSGGDFHSRTAIGMYPHVQQAVDAGKVLLEWNEADGLAPAPLVKDLFGSERRKAKTLNFSIAYGKTAHGLAKDWNVGKAEAENTLELWYANRPEVLAWQKHTIAEARKLGHTRTLLGRLRKLNGIRDTSRKLRGHAERAAINTPVQGGAADIVTMAMLKMWKDEVLRRLGWNIILQIHDEVILEGPKESAAEAMSMVKRIMERPLTDGHELLVDLSVDAKTADTWYEAK